MNTSLKGAHKGIPVDQYTLAGVYVSTYPSAAKAAAAVNVSRSVVTSVLQERALTAGGFLWTYHGETIKIPERNISYKVDENGNITEKYVNKHHKQSEVLQFNLQRELVAEYVDAYEAAEKTGFPVKAIRSACTKSNHCLVKNFYFMYRDQPYELEKRKRYYRPIVCGETGNVYQDVHAAGRAMNISPSSIYKALKSERRYTKGYHFFYQDEFKDLEFEEFVRTHSVRKSRTRKEGI